MLFSFVVNGFKNRRVKARNCGDVKMDAPAPPCQLDVRGLGLTLAQTADVHDEEGDAVNELVAGG